MHSRASAEGAFFMGNKQSNGGQTVYDTTSTYTIYFDAKTQNSIFNSNTSVQANALQTLIIIKAWRAEGCILLPLYMLFDLFAEKTNCSVHPDPVAFPVIETSDRAKAPLAAASSSLPCAIPCISPMMFGQYHARTSLGSLQAAVWANMSHAYFLRYMGLFIISKTLQPLTELRLLCAT